MQSVGRAVRHGLDAGGVDTGVKNARPLGDMIADQWGQINSGGATPRFAADAIYGA